ncbi:MAG: hypothetical protein AAF558_02060 [Verrucomicrobiota bacterium]
MKEFRNIMQIRNIFWGLLIAGMLSTASWSHAELQSEVFSYELDDLASLREALNQVITEQGKTVYLYDRRKVLVQDVDSNFDMIRAVMREFAPKPQRPLGPMVRVELFFDETGGNQRREIGVQGSVGNSNIRLGNIPSNSNRIRVEAIERNSFSSSNQVAFVMVQSGSWSRLKVVREVARPVYFYQYLSRLGLVNRGIEFEWREAGTSLEVAPIVRGNLVDLEITPVISALANARTQDFRIRSLSTRLTVGQGQKISIGGFSKADTEFNRQFFSGGNRSQSGQVSFAVRATVQSMN